VAGDPLGSPSVAAAIDDEQRGVDWRFRIGDARMKLKPLYPKRLV